MDAILRDISFASDRTDLVNAVARKAKVRPFYVLRPDGVSQVPCSRIRGGHLEIYMAGGWRRSTDLLNTAASV